MKREIHKESEFEYEKWYKKEALRLAELLMEALKVANNINEQNELWDVIEKKVKSLNLPNQNCVRCSSTMPYWDWALRDGYCDSCITELMEEMEKIENEC